MALQHNHPIDLVVSVGFPLQLPTRVERLFIDAVCHRSFGLLHHPHGTRKFSQLISRFSSSVIPLG